MPRSTWKVPADEGRPEAVRSLTNFGQLLKSHVECFLVLSRCLGRTTAMIDTAPKTLSTRPNPLTPLLAQ